MNTCSFENKGVFSSWETKKKNLFVWQLNATRAAQQLLNTNKSLNYLNLKMHVQISECLVHLLLGCLKAMCLSW